jgi:hypothetical protein
MSGGCENALEEILSGGFRFAYVAQQRCPIIDSIVVLNPRRTSGFYVPQRCIEKSLNEFTQFGQVIRAELLLLSGSERAHKVCPRHPAAPPSSSFARDEILTY